MNCDIFTGINVCFTTNALLNAEEGQNVTEEHFCAWPITCSQRFHHFHDVAYSRLAACHCGFSLTMTMETGRERGKKQDAIFGQWMG